MPAQTNAAAPVVLSAKQKRAVAEYRRRQGVTPDEHVLVVAEMDLLGVDLGALHLGDDDQVAESEAKAESATTSRSTAADDAQWQRSQYDENVGRQEWPLTAAGQDTSSARSRDESRRVPEAKDNESTCVICCEQKPAMACIPCGHMCMCPACADTFESQRDRRCPVCREFVASTMRVYT